MYREKVKDIFFDLDHTLWDFEKNSALTFQKIFQLRDVAVQLDDFLAVYVPTNAKMWKLFREAEISKEELRFKRLDTVFNQLGYAQQPETIHQLSEDYITYLSSYNHLFDGVDDVLKYLHKDYRLHIITNGFHTVQEEKLKNANIDKYFDVVVNSEMVGVKKPDPKIFEYSLTKAKANAATSIMVGDNLEADVFGAKNVGMHAIHFNTNSEQEDISVQTIYKLEELKNIL